jgi:hypothetical protein
MVDYIWPFLLLIVVGYLVFQFLILGKKTNKTREIGAMYELILDRKLIPLGFERQPEDEDMREKEVSYKRNALIVTLYSAPGLFANEIQARSGKKITLEERNNQMPPAVRNKVRYLNEQDKYQLVEALDFRIELSESEEVQAQLLETLEKWLAENQ